MQPCVWRHTFALAVQPFYWSWYWATCLRWLRRFICREDYSSRRRIAPAFAGARRLGWAAVHFSEYARDWDMLLRKEAWRNVVHPTYGMFTTLLRARLPATNSVPEPRFACSGLRVCVYGSPQASSSRRVGGLSPPQSSPYSPALTKRWNEDQGQSRKRETS